jgi:nuclease S1
MLKTMALAVLLTPTPMFAWGASGHRVTAAVAERRLSPAAKAAALQILGTAHLADVAVEPDDWKKNVLGAIHTAEWHFVDIPLKSNAFVHDRDCARSDCILDRIEQMRTILADVKAAANARKEALIFLIHFVGDLHQPLHCETGFLPNGASDRGGNEIHVTFNGGDVPGNDPPKASNDNLHFVWDVSIIVHEGRDDAQLADHLFNDTLAGRDPATLSGGKPLDWAMESHRIAKTIQVPDKTNLHDDYMTRNAAVVDERLLRGGLRLARLIETALAAH